MNSTSELKKKMCENLLSDGLVKPYDVIRHSYTNSRMSKEFKDIRENNTSPTLDTRCDCVQIINVGVSFRNQDFIGELEMEKDNCKMVGELDGKFQKMNESARRVYDPNYIAPTMTTCAGGNLEPKITENDKPEVLGGIGEKKSNNGTQFYEQNRIYDSNKVATAIPAEQAFHPYYGGNLRIRKLTPCECLRLMAFTKEDYEYLVNEGEQSASSIYHCSGDSIVVSVLIGLFASLVGAKAEPIQRRWAERVSHGLDGSQKRK